MPEAIAKTWSGGGLPLEQAEIGVVISLRSARVRSLRSLAVAPLRTEAGEERVAASRSLGRSLRRQAALGRGSGRCALVVAGTRFGKGLDLVFLRSLYPCLKAGDFFFSGGGRKEKK